MTQDLYAGLNQKRLMQRNSLKGQYLQFQGHTKDFAECMQGGLVRYVEYFGEIRKIVSKTEDEIESVLELLDRYKRVFDMSDFPEQHIALFMKTPGLHERLGLNSRLPRIDEDSAAGFSGRYPILVKRTDLVKVTTDGVMRLLSIAGCQYYACVADVIHKRFFQKATCPEQIEFYNPDGKRFQLDEKL